jgi:hypothetical protein
MELEDEVVLSNRSDGLLLYFMTFLRRQSFRIVIGLLYSWKVMNMSGELNPGHSFSNYAPREISVVPAGRNFEFLQKNLKLFMTLWNAV